MSWPTRVALFLAVLFGALVGGALLIDAAEAHHAQPDTLGAVYAAAQRHGVAAEPLVAIVLCESSGRAHAVGDSGRSRGIAQISDLPTGLAHHFWGEGYTDRDDPEQAADYLARVAKGSFLPGMPEAPPLHPHGIVSLRRWSCARLLGLS